MGSPGRAGVSVGHQGGVADIAEPAGNASARAGGVGADFGALGEHEGDEGVGVVDAVGVQGLVIETVNRERASGGSGAVGEGIEGCHLCFAPGCESVVFGVSCHCQYSTK